MACHDPQRTSRSPVTGPTNPRLVARIPSFNISVIDPAGNLYGSQSAAGVGRVFDTSGHLVRTLVSAPQALAPDGTVLAGQDSGVMFGLSPSEATQFRDTPGGHLKSASPITADDNRLYAPLPGPEDGTAGLYIFSPDGKMNRIDSRVGMGAVVRSPDGTLFSLQYGGGRATLLKYDAAGALVLSVPLPLDAACGCLMLGRNGTVYMTSGKTVEARDTTGRILWHLTMKHFPRAFAERADGSVLVTDGRVLDRVTARGRVLWSTNLHARGKTGLAAEGNVTIDGAGTAYVGTADGYVSIVGKSGRVLRRFKAGGVRGYFAPDILLDARGDLIVQENSGNVAVYR